MTDYLKTLDAEALSHVGIEGWAYGYADRVRFYELDALNHVNNTAYLRWFETIRVGYLQDYGFTNYTHGEDDPQLVVRAQTADYLAPMFQNNSYILTARTSLLKPSSFIMEYAVYVDGTQRCTGSAVMVSLQTDGKTRRLHKPQAIAFTTARDTGLSDQR